MSLKYYNTNNSTREGFSLASVDLLHASSSDVYEQVHSSPLQFCSSFCKFMTQKGGKKACFYVSKKI